MTVSHAAPLPPSLPPDPKPSSGGRSRNAASLDQVMDMIRGSSPQGGGRAAGGHAAGGYMDDDRMDGNAFGSLSHEDAQAFGLPHDDAQPVAFDGEAFLQQNMHAFDSGGVGSGSGAFSHGFVTGQHTQGPNGQHTQFQGVQVQAAHGPGGEQFQVEQFAGERIQGPLLSGQAFTSETRGGSSVHTAGGSVQIMTGGFLKEQSLQGPLLNGFAVEGGNFSTRTQETPGSRTTSFSGETFQGKFLQPTPAPFRPAPFHPAAVQPLPQPAPQPAPPHLTANGNTISDGQYEITANQFGGNTLGITDTQTHSTLTAFGDTHYEDGDGDSGNIQTSTAHLTLPNGTLVQINNTPVNAQGVSTLANVQVTAGGKTDSLSGFAGTPTLARDVAPVADAGPALDLWTDSDLNNVQVRTAKGPVAALAPNLGDTRLDQFAQPATAV